jgi:hypothetical protein
MNTNVRAVCHLTMLAVPHLEKTKVRIYIKKFAGPYFNPFSVPRSTLKQGLESPSVMCL